MSNPLLSVIFPLSPLEPALWVFTEIAPDVVASLAPLIKVITPPVAVLETLEEILKAPPSASDVTPTDSKIYPAVASADAPIHIAKAPKLPEAKVPVYSDIGPLAPSSPEFGVTRGIDPLVVATLLPDTMEMAPPVVSSSASEISPPLPALELPTLKAIEAPSLAADPVAIVMDPGCPDVDLPVSIAM